MGVNGVRRLHFEWDPTKQEANVRKHAISFRQAGSVFLDPLVITRFDEEHSESEERWISTGRALNGFVLTLVYTWTEVGPQDVKIRIISARRATRIETGRYEDQLQ